LTNCLEALGARIAIIGPSNSGKSTLGCLISRARGIPVYSLDLIRYEPGGFENLRSIEDFHGDHARLLANPGWIIEGNYSSCLQERLDRATGVILLDCPSWLSVGRYIRRCFRPGVRPGAFPGRVREPVRLAMIRHILGATRDNRTRYRRLFESLNLPKIMLMSPRAFRKFCEGEGLVSAGGIARVRRDPDDRCRSGP